MRRWPHRWTLIGLILVSGTGAAPPREGDDEGGFVSLFDGKSLAGWRQFGGKAEAWGVEGGHLVSLGHGGGWLGTSRPYADFVLRFSFLLSPESNSGIYLRAPPTPRTSRARGWKSSSSTMDIPATRTSSPGRGPGPSTTWPPPSRDTSSRPDSGTTWRSRPVAPKSRSSSTAPRSSTTDSTSIPPELIAEHTGLKRTEGLIGLQSHNGRVEFRDIRVKDLAPKATE